MFNSHRSGLQHIHILPQKSASFILALLLLLSPIEHTFAQEVTTENGAAQETSEVQAAIASPAEGQVAAMSGGSVNLEGGSVYISDSGILSDAPDVNAQTGAYKQSYPIVLPPGRSGLTPQLSLEYSSNDRSHDNVFGYGWSLPTLQIQRINKTGLNTIYLKKDFTSELDGELVTSNGINFAAEFDKGDFRKYTFANNTWVALDKNGTRYSFGSTSSSRVVDTASSTRVHAWLLDEIRDTNNNYIKFTYYKNSNKLYPETIVYTGHGTTDGIYTVNFLRENRSDTHVSYLTGFPATTTERISEIRVDVSGVWARKYEFDYNVGENGNRSLLASITESGNESGAIVTLPPTRFSYTDLTLADQAWSEANTYAVPEQIIITHEGLDQGVRFFDVNGDGYADLTMYKNTNLSLPNNVISKIYLNTGSAWVENTTWTFPQPAPRMAFSGQDLSSYHDLGARFADVNADGYTDILWSLNKCFNGWTCEDFRKVYLNNKSNGWTESTSTWQLPIDVYFNSAPGYNNGGGNEIADVNGDGLIDIVKASRYTVNGGGTYIYSTKTYLNNGSGWTEAGNNWDLPQVFEEQNTDAGTRLVELNGDGLIDMVRHVNSDYNQSVLEVDKAYVNSGNGWVETTAWKSPLPIVTRLVNYVPITHSIRFTDINGDGLSDIYTNESGAYSSNQKIYINTGEGWSDQTANWAYLGDMLLNYGYLNSDYFLTDAGVRMVDFDGDNMIDFAKNGPTNNYPNSPVYANKVMTHKGDVPDLLKTVVGSGGGTTTLEYKQSAQYKKNGTLVNGKISSNLDTVSKIRRDNGFGNIFDTKYFYEDGHYFFSSSTNRQFAGFAKVAEITDLGTTTTYYHQGNGNTTAEFEKKDTEGKIGLPYQSTLTSAANSTYQLSRTNWATSTPTLGLFVSKASELVQQYDGDSDHKDTAVSYTYSNSTGNLLSQVEWGEVTSTTTSGTFTDTGIDKKTKTYQYAANTGLNILGLPSSEIVTNQSSVKVKESKYYYDTLALGSVNKGNLTKKEDWSIGTSYINTRTLFNTYGLPIKQIDARGATTSLTYDSYNLFPTVITNPLGQSATNTYDYSSGKQKTTVGPNGGLHETVYDGLDRVINTKKPHPDTGITTLALQHIPTDTRNAVSVFSRSYLGDGTSVDEYQYFDGFGKNIQTRKEMEANGMFSVTDKVYGANGLLTRESLPYFSTGTSRTTPTTQNTLYTDYVYDPLERITSVANAVGTTTTTYDQWRQIETNPNGKQKVYVFDAYQNLTSVEEKNGASTYTTNYLWDLNKNLTRVNDALGNVRNSTYNGLSRRLTLQDLHTSADTTFGIWAYTYDSNGNLTTVVDPKAQTVQRAYDPLNRLVTENFIGTSGIEATYVYDSCQKGIGYVCLAKNTDATTTYTYNHAGQVAVQKETVNGVIYTATTTYNLRGDIATSTYPDGSSVVNKYDTAGNLNSIAEKQHNGILRTVVTDLDYGPLGQIVYRENGNGTRSSYVFDPAALYRLRSIETIALAGTGNGGQEQQSIEQSLMAENTFLIAAVESTAATSGPLLVHTTIDQKADTQNTLEELSLQSSTTATRIEPPTQTPDLTRTSTSSLEVLLTEKARKVQNANIDILLKDKSREEKILEKQKAILSQDIVGRSSFQHDQGTIDVDIQKIEPIEGGVQVFAKAWGKDGNQMAFGRNGTIETERFRIFNPPIILASQDKSTGEWLLTEDPKQALLKVLTDTIAEIGKPPKYMVAGTVGNTTSIFFSDASGDGDITSGNAPFTTTRNGYSLTVDTVDDDGNVYLDYEFYMRHLYFPFATDPLPDSDVIDTATLSINHRGLNEQDNNALSVGLLKSIQSSATSLTTAHWAPESYSIEYGARKSISSLNNAADETYVSWNITNLGIINTTGVTPFMLVVSKEIDDDSAGITATNYSDFYFADSTGTSRDPKLIVEHSTYVPPSPESTTLLQRHIYQYDPVGNITSVVTTKSATSTFAKRYTYDDLNRLTSYGTSTATVVNPTSTTPTISLGSNVVKESYTYSALGNLLSKTGQGSYVYAGNTGTLKVNPHAPTSVNGVGYTYDNNGNMLTRGSNTYTWSYDNRLRSSVEGGNTLTYKYNNGGSRVARTKGAVTTLYPFQNYEIQGATTTKHIMVGGVPALTVETKGTTTKTHHVHTDHLGSTDITTNDQGLVAQSISYQPFGEEKVSTGKNTTGRHYIGQTYDTDTALSYLNARYYRPDRGQFLSQDPVFNEVGLTEDGKMILLNPQLANSYSYAGNNPISGKDPTGRAREDARRHSQAMAKQKQQEMYRGAEARFHKSIDTVGKVGQAGIAGVGLYAGIRMAPSATVGAVTNVAGTVAANRVMGRETTTRELVTSAAVGTILGPVTSGMGLRGSIIATGIASAGVSSLLNGTPQTQDVASDTFAAGVGKVVQSVQSLSSLQQTSANARAVVGGVSEISAKTVLTALFRAFAQ